jgi:8-oxo-dGTP diphosphatase
MEDFEVAVKSFIVKGNRILVIKRKNNNPHKPGAWEIPGGRLKPGENPFEGLKRETKEETGIEIEIMNPLGVHHFTRDDGQKITMIIFLCKPLSDEVKLSNEHENYIWADPKIVYEKLNRNFHGEVKFYQKYFSKS